MKYMYITNNPAVAAIADRAGVDWVFVDLETLGKAERQRGLDSVKSHHSVADAARLRGLLRRAQLLVRVDPLHDGSPEQIERVIAAGADTIMLPMWKTPEDLARFIRLVGGRCQTMPLLETREAAACLDEALAQPGIDRMHIGLNDLHLSLRRDFMFELLADGTVERLCDTLRRAGVPYGFGGVGRPGSGLVPAEHILGEHVRLGSDMVILSRSFCDASKASSLGEIEADFAASLRALRAQEAAWRDVGAAVLERNRKTLCREVADIVSQIRTRKLEEGK